MITDEETNTLFLADTLSKYYPVFNKSFENVLKECSINCIVLPETKDVWAVDYMPIQVDLQKFVRFDYHPKYLKTKQELNSISDAERICEGIGIKTIQSDLVVDGGNVIRARDRVIMSERIFDENPGYSRSKLIKALRELLEVDDLFLVPVQPGDFTGHADGMVRFLNSDTVIINDYQKESTSFRRAFETAIKDSGLNYVTIPYNPYSNKNDDQANGCYINYLQMEGLLIIPVFGMKEDEEVVKIFEELFSGQIIKTVESNEIANDGGILNCITWNIRT